jgi:hypothetical protein
MAAVTIQAMVSCLGKRIGNFRVTYSKETKAFRSTLTLAVTYCDREHLLELRAAPKIKKEDR